MQLDGKSVGNFMIEYDPRQGEWIKREWILEEHKEVKEQEEEEKPLNYAKKV